MRITTEFLRSPSCDGAAMELRRAWLREFIGLDSRGCRNKPICLIREIRLVYWGEKFWSWTKMS